MENKAEFHFHIIDYAVFGGMLLLSVVSGVYFGIFRKKSPSKINKSDQNQNNPGNFGSLSLNEYLLGSRNLKSFPVAMSLVASYISGVTILGTPAEIYNYGTQYWLIIIPILFMGFTVSTVYLPVFSSLKVGSSYEYLEMRFNITVRTIASIMFVMDEILFLPIVVYVPALAFNQVTGVDIHLIGGIVCVVCVFYTLIGGIKAVVVTDSWQIMLMFLSVCIVTALGTYSVGGPAEVYRRALIGGRVKFFDFNPSMYQRHTFWGVIIGGFLYWTSFNSVNQTMVQRYMTLPNLKLAQYSVAMFTFGIVAIETVCCYAGVLIYAAFYKCDPLSSGLVKADDQLFPFFVMQSAGHLRGIPGLFVAGVFGAALSSLSVVLSSTSAVFLEDIIKGCFKLKPSERAASYIVKGSILGLGALAMGCLYIVEMLGGIFGVTVALSAIAAGCSFGVFSLGMLVPWSNSKGAICGAIAGAIISGWTSFGIQAAVASGSIIPHKLGVSMEECLINNKTYIEPVYPDESSVFPLYRLSFHWINPIGVSTVILVGSIVSFITGNRKLIDIDPQLISPVIHRFLPKKCFENFGNAKKNYKKQQLNTSIIDCDLTSLPDNNLKCNYTALNTAAENSHLKENGLPTPR